MIEGRHFEVALVFRLTRNYCSLRADDDSLNAKDAFNARSSYPTLTEPNIIVKIIGAIF